MFVECDQLPKSSVGAASWSWQIGICAGSREALWSAPSALALWNICDLRRIPHRVGVSHLCGCAHSAFFAV